MPLESVGMRVISGRFKGVALATPKTGTRPTTDRTKEAVFSRLDAWGVLDGARVLDLFAGTGALGIEALSRGGRELVAVEASKPAAALIVKTIAQLKRNRSWSSDLAVRVLVPPYAFETEACDRLLADLAANGFAGDGTVIVLERSARSDAPTPPAGWEITDHRDYGETAVFYIEPTE